MGAATKQEYFEFWEILKAKNVSEDCFKEIAKTFKISEKLAANSVSLLKKVASSGTLEDFVTYIESRELPAVKLTPSEMEAVKGGASLPYLDIVRIIKNSTILIPV
jgi:hypothetical protein